jgi:(2Fe-2S) ferredoxin
MSRGAQAVYTQIATTIADENLGDVVVQTQCGCVAPFCGQGPMVCAYPSGAWYSGVDEVSSLRIVREDLATGEPAEGLHVHRIHPEGSNSH